MSRLLALGAALALACPLARAAAAAPADPVDPTAPDAAWASDVEVPAEAPARAAAPGLRGDRSPGLGALRGAEAVLGTFGRICVSGGGVMLLVCAFVVVEFWPYLLGVTATGAVIGAAIGAPPGKVVAVGRPSEPAPRATRPAEPRPAPDTQPAPESEWSGS